MSTKDHSWIVLALRDHDTSKWKLDLLLLFQGEIHAAIADRIRDNAEVRWIGGTVHSSGGMLREKGMRNRASRHGWHIQDNSWIPIEEPLLLPRTKSLDETIVTLVLKNILFGSITFEINAGDSRLDLVISDVSDNPVTLVRFIQILNAGGLPHAAMTNETWCDVVVSEGPSPDQCRFFVNNEYPGQEGHIDTITNKAMLGKAFSDLALQIGMHPYFAHHYLSHGLPMEDYERVVKAHDEDWAAGVKQGIYPNDMDAEDMLFASRIVEGVTLPVEYAKEAAKYRHMLQSLEIPQDWQLKFGFRPIVTDHDITELVGF
ncbi:MAG: hypothetical protein KIT48_09025 [Pseudolabrys sp.]|nr:hypothetical protein [Pseudolabrys sp.]